MKKAEKDDLVARRQAEIEASTEKFWQTREAELEEFRKSQDSDVASS